MGAFDVLGQLFVVKDFADITGSEGPVGLAEDGEDSEAVQALAQVGRGGLGQQPVSESCDGPPGDREVFEMDKM
ncbi:hypothetical protein [Streptomyces djakartensis]|uniref:Uncharacterized protein n=1 Tax=Streptomyces djakartensis TaxID=68193 RepID=A0ABQ2Z5T9_9ACTN|nr:hypothetical protein [Streptomyces djakartensis]GGY02664.1 hypothetical protein GCM10010384_03240 [Streptomyces djakartensis]